MSQMVRVVSAQERSSLLQVQPVQPVVLACSELRLQAESEYPVLSVVHTAYRRHRRRHRRRRLLADYPVPEVVVYR